MHLKNHQLATELVNYVSPKSIQENPKSIQYSRHLLITLTCNQDLFDGSKETAWAKLSVLNTRWVQKIRRLTVQLGLGNNPVSSKSTTFDGSVVVSKSTKVQSVEYIRALESHKSGWPHSHWVIQFQSSCIPYSSNKNPYKKYNFIHNDIVKKFKETWQYGNSDIQVPYSKSHGLNYLLKYITKGSSAYSTFWKNVYKNNPQMSKPLHSKDTASVDKDTARVLDKIEDYVSDDKTKLASKIHGNLQLKRSKNFDDSVFFKQITPMIDDKQTMIDGRHESGLKDYK